ncbi:MAG: lipid-A-disaccharide synthase [Armatimonadota bacterium]
MPWILAVKNNMTVLFCSAGEASGDGSCASLIHQLRLLSPQMRIEGIGGPKLRAEGVSLWHDTSHWGSIGLVEALRRLPVVWLTSLIVRARIFFSRPDALLLVDFGAFNTRLAQWYKRWVGGDVYYYFPPGSWRKNPTSRCDLANYADLVITPFPWSATYLKQNNVNAYFCGHPMLDTLENATPRDQFRGIYGVDEQSVLIGLLPGSRRQEIRHNTPAMVNGIKLMMQHHSDVEAMVAIGNPSERGWILKQFTQGGVPVKATEDSHGLMRAADMLWTCSGTATLEAAVLGTPMIIMYRGSKLLELEYNLLKHKIQMFGMPNLIYGSKIISELVQNDANPERLLQESEAIWPGSAGASKQVEVFKQIKQQLGSPGATLQAAQLISQHLASIPAKRSK